MNLALKIIINLTIAHLYSNSSSYSNVVDKHVPHQNVLMIQNKSVCKEVDTDPCQFVLPLIQILLPKNTLINKS